MCKELLETLAKSLVTKPDEVSVTMREKEDGTVVCELRVAEGDMGRVIGKQGKTAKCIRTIMKAAATKDNIKLSVDIID